MRLRALVAAWLLLAVIITGAAPSVAEKGPFIAASPAGLTVTLVSDNDNYLRGETIQISGTVKDSLNKPVTSGTVTVQFLYGEWSQKSTVQIVNGSYSDNYYISYGNPTGVWTITASATDDLGDTGTKSKNIAVASPDNDVYRVKFTSPDNHISYSRGRTLTISTTITDNEDANVDGADSVFANSPSGENIPLSEKGGGVYENTYTIKFNDPAENWSLSVEGRKTTDNTFRAGGVYLNIQVVPATLQVELQSPTQATSEARKSVEVRVKVSYPFDGGAVEGATVSVNDPEGGSLTPMHQGGGIYRTTYTPQSPADWTMQVQAEDSYGNSGEKSSLIHIIEPRVPGFLEQYWWAILSVALAIVLASVYRGREKRLALKLADVQREIKEIPRLKKEAAIKYFKNGTISRNAYDGLIKRYDARMDVLKKQDAALRGKLKKGKRKK